MSSSHQSTLSGIRGQTIRSSGMRSNPSGRSVENAKPYAGPGDLCTCRGKPDLETSRSSPQSTFHELFHHRLRALSSSPSLKKFTETVAHFAVMNDCDTEWVEAQIQGLLPLVKRSVRDWITTLCGGTCVFSWLKDERSLIPESELQQRLTVEGTDSVLKAFEAEIEQYFRKASDRAVGEASIEMAKTGRLSPHPVPTADAPKGFDGLGKKKHDYSEFFDTARLTNAQRDCASMKWEYGLEEVTKIAKRLRVHHSTVQEHLAAVAKKLGCNREFERALKQRVAHGGSRDDY